MSTLSKKIKRNRDFNVFFNENFEFGDDFHSLEAGVIQIFVSSSINNCTMNQARALLENILDVKEIDGVNHYTGILATEPDVLQYYYGGRDEFKDFINKNFFKNDAAEPIPKSTMIMYFRFYAIADGIRCALSKVEKELDKLIETAVIDGKKYYKGYSYIREEVREESDIDL
jgi:hypothetical protein